MNHESESGSRASTTKEHDINTIPLLLQMIRKAPSSLTLQDANTLAAIFEQTGLAEEPGKS